MLGGKSVNGNPVIFPLEDATPYHIYHKVLNAKNYGVPQNRERVFIVGIRDDSDNNFTWAKKQHLTKRLKDVLEDDVDEKYYLSDKMIKCLANHKSDKFSVNTPFLNTTNIARTLRTDIAKMGRQDNYLKDNIIKIGNTNPSGNGMNGNVFDAEGISPTLSTNKGEGIKVKSATKKGFEIANEGDSINLMQPNSETRRGRVGKGVEQTLDTGCSQAVIQIVGNIYPSKGENGDIINPEGISKTIKSGSTNNPKNGGVGSCNAPKIMIGAIRGRNPENPLSREIGLPTEQRLELNLNGTSNALTTVQKDNVVMQINPSLESGGKQPYQGNRVYDDRALSPTLQSQNGGASKGSTIICESHNYKIRRLTPRECANLMDFPKTFTWTVSNSQIYKQMGNSIVVSVLAAIISKLKL
jgi:site-specific DNA-cytosine methylase